MKFRPTITFRIGFGIGIIILAIIINGVFIYKTIDSLRILKTTVAETFDPTIKQLIVLYSNIHEVEDLLTDWLYGGKLVDSPYPDKINSILNKDLPATYRQLFGMSVHWSEGDQQRLVKIYQYITDSLNREINDLFSLSPSDVSPPSHSIDTLQPLTVRIEIYFRHTYSEISYLQDKFNRLYNQSMDNADSIFISSSNYILFTQIILVLVTILIAVFLIRSLVRPVNSFKKVLYELSKGELPDIKLTEGRDEIGQMAAALNKLVGSFKSLTYFSQEIGKGNFDAFFEPLSEKDILGNSLIRMREDLKNAAVEEQKRKVEDESRNWITHGIARLSEILREYSNKLEELTYQVISNLVKYLDAQIGGLFLIITDEKGEKNIELVATYAYGRKKYLKKTIHMGEGLIGRCVQEGETIYMTEIPDDYIKIKSGLGENNPRSLIIVPLKLNEEIIGVIEIASLSEIKPHQIEFIERIGNSIASSLSIVRKETGQPERKILSALFYRDLPGDPEMIKKEISKMELIKSQAGKREQELKDELAKKGGKKK